MELDCADKRLDLSHPRVMGILNVTPDSFHDGGRFTRLDAALRQAEQLVGEGADIVDVGGESTRPGAAAVGENEELDRVIPVIERLASELAVPVSIDTSKPRVMREAVQAGAGLINDVRALREPGALETAARAPVPVCLMHMQGQPRTMQAEPRYTDVVAEVRDFLLERVEACEAAGIGRERLVIDPGIGFGKTIEHNLALFRGLPELARTGLPLLVGVSRKSMLGALLARRQGRSEPVPSEGRLYASVGAAVVAALGGARLLRVHDVAATCEALAVASAMQAG
jgi:dihydropteroate synthase